jgi:hypothetical protein
MMGEDENLVIPILSDLVIAAASIRKNKIIFFYLI